MRSKWAATCSVTVELSPTLDQQGKGGVIITVCHRNLEWEFSDTGGWGVGLWPRCRRATFGM